MNGVDPDITGSLEEQVAELRARVRLLERTIRAYGFVPQNEDAPPAKAALSAAPPPTTPIEATPALPQTHKDHGSLESRIGSQWFNRIGILAVLIGMAWFLKWAVDNHWIGPLGRVLVGLIAGAGLIAWSERIRSRGYPGFSYSLKALGSGILYLSQWAAFSLFHLIPAAAAFTAMIVVTAFNGFMSWLQDSELLALYAIVGGLSAPILVYRGEPRSHALQLPVDPRFCSVGISRASSLVAPVVCGLYGYGLVRPRMVDRLLFRRSVWSDRIFYRLLLLPLRRRTPPGHSEH